MRRLFRFRGCCLGIIIFICLLMVLVLVWARQRFRTEAIMVGGHERNYQIHVPDHLQTPAPLVIALHGGGGNGRGMRTLTHFDTVADEHGFIVVYPYGINRAWNDGRASNSESYTSTADDVAFIRALIDQLSQAYSIDEQRIFVTGISNGGLMSYRLACELSDRIAGIAAVAANMTPIIIEGCQPQKPVAVIIMNGTADPLIPYEGGTIKVFETQRGTVVSTQETLEFWLAHNNCSDSPNEVALDDREMDDTRVYVTAYQNCAAPVQLYRIDKGGHTWAGGMPYLPERIVGKVNRDIDASSVIWAFFESIGQ